MGAGGRGPNPGSGRRRRGPAGAQPTISRLAAGCPLSPGATGALLRSTQSRARGLTVADSSRHAPAGTSPGGGGGGERVGRDRRATAPTRVGEGQASPRAGSREAAERKENGRNSPTSRCPPVAQRASSSRPPEGNREGGGGSAHAARSFRRRRCPNRGRPREKETK